MKKCEGGQTTIHFTADPENVQIIMNRFFDVLSVVHVSFSRSNLRRPATTLSRSSGEGSQRAGNGDFTSGTT